MSWIAWPFRIVAFIAWFTTQVITANASVLRDNLSRGQSSTPGIARVITRCRSDLEVTLLAALITLTPGTLTMGTEKDSVTGARVLFVHGLYFADADGLRADARRIESRMLGAVRREGGPE
ncbi:multicomponent Na+:H+ antiporter subunit E [Microbacterium sp. AG1240]|uniref:Na+/H+ antiporter subunit E n=1 Tax=Microbacterium sp. AG1240 TaxID=2183992 RepID=UPI000EADB9BD|nr:Na+/H+ antiporter subunit E [Microbacterium sp. AG1240]RKT33557.1 multicomponent Na+:H+ antiporter subunit E [Microbacterium sp. AG1240]